MIGLHSIPTTAPTPPVRRGTCNRAGGDTARLLFYPQTARTFSARFAFGLAAGRGRIPRPAFASGLIRFACGPP